MAILYSIAFIYIVYLSLRGLVVVLNLIYNPTLKKNTESQCALVSLCIPARNEEKNIKALLTALYEQSYKNIEILVYNDLSTDNTEKTIIESQKTNPNIKLLQGKTLPTGWLGKNHACYQLAQKAKGDYILFLDADVIPQNHLVSTLVSITENNKTQLLSVFPKQLTQSFGEKLIVPHMKNILLSLLPLLKVKTSHRVSYSAANGQCMMFEAKTYKRYQPHQWKKDEKVEDIAIMRLYKKFHLTTETYIGKGTIQCKMYNSGKEAINGFSRNIKQFFGNSTIFMLFHAIITSVGFFSLTILPFKHFIFIIFILLLLHGGLLHLSQRKWWEIFFIPLQQFALLYLTLVSIYKNKKGKLNWKGRAING
jgi:glycosyltransferase involved in cell wall biosynthesis